MVPRRQIVLNQTVVAVELALLLREVLFAGQLAGPGYELVAGLGGVGDPAGFYRHVVGGRGQKGQVGANLGVGLLGYQGDEILRADDLGVLG